MFSNREAYRNINIIIKPKIFQRDRVFCARCLFLCYKRPLLCSSVSVKYFTVGEARFRFFCLGALLKPICIFFWGKYKICKEKDYFIVQKTGIYAIL